MRARLPQKDQSWCESFFPPMILRRSLFNSFCYWGLIFYSFPQSHISPLSTFFFFLDPILHATGQPALRVTGRRSSCHLGGGCLGQMLPRGGTGMWILQGPLIGSFLCHHHRLSGSYHYHPHLHHHRRLVIKMIHIVSVSLFQFLM